MHDAGVVAGQTDMQQQQLSWRREGPWPVEKAGRRSHRQSLLTKHSSPAGGRRKALKILQRGDHHAHVLLLKHEKSLYLHWSEADVVPLHPGIFFLAWHFGTLAGSGE